MSRLRQIKRRIKSVDNIAKVTHAMQLVAASRMRRAQENAEMGKDYTRKIQQIMLRLAMKSGGEEENPLMVKQIVSAAKVLVVVFSPERGLAGSLPGNLVRYILKLIAETKDVGNEVAVVTVGKKVRDQLARRGVEIIADFTDMPERPTTGDVRPILKLIQESFTQNEVSKVIMVYPQFVHALLQKPVTKVLLPLSIEEVKKYDDNVTADLSTAQTDFIYEPSRSVILANLVPGYLETQIYQARLETVASEYSARMVAMKNATTNAKEVRSYLTLEYNKSRQAQITKELAEISAGRLARR